MNTHEQTVLMPLRYFPLQDYSRDALEAFVREYTSPHWEESLVLHNHYVIFNDYNEDIDAFATNLYRALKKEKPESFSGIIDEDVLLSNPQRLQQKAFNRNYLLFVTNCKDSEMDEEDSAQWEDVRKITETPNAPTIILCTTKETFEKRFRGNDALYHRFFTRETRIAFKEDFAPEEIHSLLNEEIDIQLPFQRTDEFDTRMTDYLKDVYPKADLKRRDFIEDMLRRINALYYQKGLDNELLTEACVPFWKPVVDGTSPSPTEPEEASDEDSPSEESPVKETSEEQSTTDIPDKCKNCSAKEPNKKEETPEITPKLIRIPKFTGNSTDSDSNNAQNILILALSTLSGRGYRKTKSYDSEENAYEYYYQLEPVPQMIQKNLSRYGQKLDKILILASAATLDPANHEVPIDGNKMLQLLDGPDDFICQASALDYFAYRLKEYFGDDMPEIRTFKYENTTGANISNITKPLYQMLSEIRKTPKATLYTDIHGGLRQQQQILSGIMSLLEIEGIPMKPSNVFSVEFDDGKSRIIEASESIQINKFVSGINELSKYARIGSLKEYIQGADDPDVQNLLHTLESISSDIQFCNVAHFEKDFKRLPGNLHAVQKQGANSMLALFLDDVRGTFGKLAEGKISVPDEVRWCMEKGFYQQALSIIEAKMPMYLIENGIIDCDNNAEDYIAKEGRFDVGNKLRLYPDILKTLTNTVKDIYQKTNKTGVAFSQILQNSEQRIVGFIIKPNSQCKWSYDYIDFTFDTPNAAKLMVLHATFKTLRNAMNHPNRNLNFTLDSENVEKRITEYLDLAMEMAANSESNPAIHLKYNGKYRPKYNNNKNEIAQIIATFSSDKKQDSSMFTGSTSLVLPDPKPVENVNPEAVKKYAQMFCTYVQGTGTTVFNATAVYSTLGAYFPGGNLPGKKEIYTSGSGKVLDAVCESYPDLFRQEDIKIIVTLPSDN